ncbi:sugar transferase [Paenibacillus eucommiae]|uniref:Lipopolysaccharide/colanic/teichoic acid biosynthesis glycosyltransferase n=1 Tax=Paenibacillus eucommiae TaxID=1355755 RepID=A0ABS4IRU6_9BACL|nr:sugar transferase [Paenibacillus eucommiae]MBP1990297.1 lipopolysaccharide/colanic/teichoic acid biosynthesis glycosyltransferase [Paenibacillus eucommiae]
MKIYMLVKRFLDVVFAIVLLILSSPVMLCVAIAIKLESKGDALFKQSRPGKQGKIFKVYKFRSMRAEVGADGKPLPDMNRITRVGAFIRKTSLDELPQLFNVVRGEMSFIGPRPLLVEYLAHYSPEQMRRHHVTPGISGWAQVNGRNAISWEEKFKLDVWYVDHCSFSLDVKIVAITIKSVLFRKGVNSSNSETMPFFVGKENTKMVDG